MPGVTAAPRTRAPRPATTSRRATAFGDAKFSVTLGAGIYYRRRAVEFGLAYQSRPLGSDVSGVEVAGQRTRHAAAERPDGRRRARHLRRTGSRAAACSATSRTGCPTSGSRGATWRLRPGLELTAMVRWLWLSVHDRIDVRMSGPPLDQGSRNCPSTSCSTAASRTSGTRACASPYWWRERVRVGAMLRLETSAVDDERRQRGGRRRPQAAAGRADRDPDPAPALARRRLWRHIHARRERHQLRVQARIRHARCADSGNNLATEACQARARDARARRPPGTTRRSTHDFGLTLTLKF